MRLALPLAVCAVAFLVTDASAHVGYKIQMTAVYKETKKGDVVFRNVFVTGHAHYPDGTVLKVGIRPEKMSTGYLCWSPLRSGKKSSPRKWAPGASASPRQVHLRGMVQLRNSARVGQVRTPDAGRIREVPQG